ncbi:MAG TPA: TlpA family protein disulfide reductase, partial [Chromatiaceae bacterium]|nr:TlpA family protein disulfide reductase [Chromatiaceae bacterium]
RIEKQGIAMVAINVGEDEDTIFSFTGDYPIDFPIWMDREGDKVAAWPVRGLPTTFVLDTEGRIVYRAIGGREWDDDSLLDKVRALRKPHEQ